MRRYKGLVNEPDVNVGRLRRAAEPLHLLLVFGCDALAACRSVGAREGDKLDSTLRGTGSSQAREDSVYWREGDE